MLTGHITGRNTSLESRTMLSGQSVEHRKADRTYAL